MLVLYCCSGTSSCIEFTNTRLCDLQEPFRRLPSILNDFLSGHVRRAWLQNSRSRVFEFIGQYQKLLCRLTMPYWGFVFQRRTFELQELLMVELMMLISRSSKPRFSSTFSHAFSFLYYKVVYKRKMRRWILMIHAECRDQFQHRLINLFHEYEVAI